MHVGNYLGLTHDSEQQLVNAFISIAEHHGSEPDIAQICQLLSSWSLEHIQALKPLIERYTEEKSDEPEQLYKTMFDKPRTGSLALLRDLHDLWLLANQVQLCWTVLLQAAKALQDEELETTCSQCSAQTKRQIAWLLNRIKQAAPQTLVVAA